MSLVGALTPVVEVLDQLGITYHIGGSVASSSHGAPRTTNDVDVVADLRPEHVRPLCDSLRGAYYAEPQLLHEAIRKKSCANLIHLASGYKVDLFVCKNTEYDRGALERHVIRTLAAPPNDREFRLATPEDTVLQKLRWYRAGGEVSDRQWNDVLGLLRARGERLDRDYLDPWARHLGIDDLLAKARREARDDG